MDTTSPIQRNSCPRLGKVRRFPWSAGHNRSVSTVTDLRKMATSATSKNYFPQLPRGG